MLPTYYQKATLTLAALLLVSGSLETATACSCVGVPSARKAKRTASAMFVGQVVKVELRETEIPRYSNGRRIVQHKIATLEVHQVWKGKIPRVVSVTTDLHGEACGVAFTLGEMYLVDAGGPLDDLWTSTCRHSRHLSRAKESLEALGKPRRTVEWGDEAS